MKKYNIAVVICRVQPVHNAHLKLFQEALKLAEKLIIFIGSANSAINYKNPFTFEQRKSMLKDSFFEHKIYKNYVILPLEDWIYNEEKWLFNVNKSVYEYASQQFLYEENVKICIVGHKKDDTSYYLNSFPKWDFIDVGKYEQLSSTQIRELLFTNNFNENFIKSVVPTLVLTFLKTFKNSEQYYNLLNEKLFIEKYKQQFCNLPYELPFITTDAVVIQSGYVLMVKRGAYPGYGQLAFPGGFLNASQDRSIKDAMLRELMEETKIKVPLKVLEGNITKVKVFDHPNRSLRGRTITHAYKIHLPDGEWNLPKVKGSDDAAEASWKLISSLKREDCYEDHYEILMYMLGI